MAQSPNQAAPPGSAPGSPDPTPWYGRPLPDRYDFGPSGFAGLAGHVEQQAAATTAAAAAAAAVAHQPIPYRAAPFVACYGNQQQRAAAINGALPDDRPQYEAGRAVGSVTRHYPTRKGGVGMVASPYANAAVSSATGANDWHTVGVLRHDHTVWIHDPAYYPPADGTIQRLPMVPGLSNVTRLLNSTGFGTVNQLFIQGPPGSPTAFDSLQCMGRSAQWVDNVTHAPGATDPYPAGHFQPGQAPPGFYPLQRT